METRFESVTNSNHGNPVVIYSHTVTTEKELCRSHSQLCYNSLVMRYNLLFIFDMYCVYEAMTFNLFIRRRPAEIVEHIYGCAI